MKKSNDRNPRDLTDREQKVLNFTRQEVRKKGYPPTVREICAALGIKSTSTVYKDLENLEAKGYIHREDGKPRAISVISSSTKKERRKGKKK